VVGPDGGIVQPSDDAGPAPTGDGGGRVNPPPVTDGGPDQTVCGTMTCNSTTDVCCLATRMCVAANAACRGSTLVCSGSNSCAAGNVCCQEAVGRDTTSKCLTKCPAGDPQLCTTNADCTAPDVCRAAGADYGVCARPVMVPPPRDAGVIVPPRLDGGGFPGH
jgi:hypothetical protein